MATRLSQNWADLLGTEDDDAPIKKSPSAWDLKRTGATTTTQSYAPPPAQQSKRPLATTTTPSTEKKGGGVLEHTEPIHIDMRRGNKAVVPCEEKMDVEDRHESLLRTHAKDTKLLQAKRDALGETLKRADELGREKEVLERDVGSLREQKRLDEQLAKERETLTREVENLRDEKRALETDLREMQTFAQSHEERYKELRAYEARLARERDELRKEMAEWQQETARIAALLQINKK